MPVYLLAIDEFRFDRLTELAAPVANVSVSSTSLTTAAASIPEVQPEIDVKNEADYEDISEIERVEFISLSRL